MQQLYYNDSFKHSTQVIMGITITPVINKYLACCKTTTLNKNMYSDLFLDSHRKLTLKSMQTIYDVDNFIIIGETLYCFELDEEVFYNQVVGGISVEIFLDFNIKEREFFIFLENKLFVVIGSDSKSDSIQYPKIYITTPRISYRKINI